MFVADEIKRLEKNPQFVAEGLALTVAEQTARLLIARRMNPMQLAEAMGVSRAQVSNVLNASPNITMLTLAKLSLALGVTPDVIMSSAGL